MAEAFTLKLVTPEGTLFDGAVEAAIAVGTLGVFGVLAHHIDFVTSLRPGLVNLVESEGRTQSYLVSGGIAEVKNGALTLLVPQARLAGEIDTANSEQRLKAARERLARLSSYEPDYPEAEQELLMAQAVEQVAALQRSHR